MSSRETFRGIDDLPFAPHGYQADAFDAYFAEHDGRGRPQLIVMATGLGKSVTACLIARRVIGRGGRVLVLAHLDNLIGQLAGEFAEWGLPSVVEKAERRALDMVSIASPLAHCVVACVATLKGKRLASWPRDYFDLIITDEAHRAVSDSYKAIFSHFSRAKLLGLTATPNRDDGKNLREVFERTAYEYRLPDAIARGDLCRFEPKTIECGVDLRDIKVIGKKGEQDFDPDRVGERIGPHVVRIAKAIVLGDGNGSHLGPGQTLIFAPCRLSSQAWADAMTQLGVPCASVDYKTPDVRRYFDRFREGTMARHGDLAALSNLGLCTTGFNHRSIGNIILSRPTQSWLLLEQMLGRGTRLCEGKTTCKILDLGWIVEADKIARPVDLFLPPGVDPLVRDAARDAAASGVDLSRAAEDAVRKAEEAAERKRKRDEAAERRRSMDRGVRVTVGEPARVKHRARPFDLFGVAQIAGVRVPAPAVGTVAIPASAESAARLRDLGFDGADGMSQREADLMLAHWEQRRECGMATLKQVRFLAGHGHDADRVAAMSARDAAALIGPLMARFRAKSG